MKSLDLPEVPPHPGDRWKEEGKEWGTPEWGAACEAHREKEAEIWRTWAQALPTEDLLMLAVQEGGCGCCSSFDGLYAVKEEALSRVEKIKLVQRGGEGH